VVDAYTTRLLRRYPIDAGKGYKEVKVYFKEHLPQSANLYNGFHAQIVINGKRHCKSKPSCEGCPLCRTCGKCF
jgi:endonuclease III related protein